jgi:hypothetical protein
MKSNATNPQRPDVQPRHERRLQAAARLLSESDSDAAVLEHCESVLSSPGYSRSQAQAALDATNAILALNTADVSTRRTREACQLLTAVAGGSHV